MKKNFIEVKQLALEGCALAHSSGKFVHREGYLRTCEGTLKSSLISFLYCIVRIEEAQNLHTNSLNFKSNPKMEKQPAPGAKMITKSPDCG